MKIKLRHTTPHSCMLEWSTKERIIGIAIGINVCIVMMHFQHWYLPELLPVYMHCNAVFSALSIPVPELLPVLCNAEEIAGPLRCLLFFLLLFAGNSIVPQEEPTLPIQPMRKGADRAHTHDSGQANGKRDDLTASISHCLEQIVH